MIAKAEAKFIVQIKHNDGDRSFPPQCTEESGKPRYYDTPEEADRIADELRRSAPITDGEYVVVLAMTNLPKGTKIRIDPPK